MEINNSLDSPWDVIWCCLAEAILDLYCRKGSFLQGWKVQSNYWKKYFGGK